MDDKSRSHPGQYDALSQRCLLLALHLRRRTNIKTTFLYCHVVGGMKTDGHTILIMCNIGMVGGGVLNVASEFD